MRALAAALVTLTACGGKVVYLEDGDGGGSSSSSPSSAAGTEQFEPGPEPDPRGEVCALWCQKNACSTELEDCEKECAENFGAGCDSPIASYLGCLGEGFDVEACQQTDPCVAEEQAVAECPPGWCSEGCSDTDQSCSCLRNCDDRALLVDCTLVGDAQADCDCKIDGTVVSTCSETHLACDMDFGCCAQAFGF
jgi:hypothetical protein